MNVKSITRKCALSLVLGGVIATLAAGILVRSSVAQAPSLILTPTTSNQFQLFLSNAAPGETYVIYRRPILGHPNYPWRFYLLGATNMFTVDMGTEPMSFFQAVSGTNWDGDASVNWEDGDALNPNIGRLSVTIDSPTNGSIVQ